mmetsp:Transcript_23917/g.60049  ORF Transcript_23917/g.60049 Transcript_23917/m.60049 type:complete len:213 (-) Transcript_23917:1694-2332(-)
MTATTSADSGASPPAAAIVFAERGWPMAVAEAKGTDEGGLAVGPWPGPIGLKVSKGLSSSNPSRSWYHRLLEQMMMGKSASQAHPTIIRQAQKLPRLSDTTQKGVTNSSYFCEIMLHSPNAQRLSTISFVVSAEPLRLSLRAAQNSSDLALAASIEVATSSVAVLIALIFAVRSVVYCVVSAVHVPKVQDVGVYVDDEMPLKEALLSVKTFV